MGVDFPASEGPFPAHNPASKSLFLPRPKSEDEELAAAVAQYPDLAVLEYTFCDEGLVVVGLGPGRQSTKMLFLTILSRPPPMNAA